MWDLLLATAIGLAALLIGGPVTAVLAVAIVRPVRAIVLA